MGTDVEEFLAHHGVKGMRWGFRKKRGGGGVEQTGRTRGEKTTGMVDPAYKKNTDGTHNPNSSDYRGHATAHLTDTQVRNRINRIRMEKEYAQLTAPELSPAKKWLQGLGKKLAENAQTVVANTITNQVTSALTQAVANAKSQKKAPTDSPKPETKAAPPQQKKEGTPPYSPGTAPVKSMRPTETVRKAGTNFKATMGNFMRAHGKTKTSKFKDYGQYKFEAGTVIDENGKPVRPKKR